MGDTCPDNMLLGPADLLLGHADRGLCVLLGDKVFSSAVSQGAAGQRCPVPMAGCGRSAGIGALLIYRCPDTCEAVSG